MAINRDSQKGTMPGPQNIKQKARHSICKQQHEQQQWTAERRASTKSERFVGQAYNEQPTAAGTNGAKTQHLRHRTLSKTKLYLAARCQPPNYPLSSAPPPPSLTSFAEAPPAADRCLAPVARSDVGPTGAPAAFGEARWHISIATIRLRAASRPCGAPPDRRCAVPAAAERAV